MVELDGEEGVEKIVHNSKKVKDTPRRKILWALGVLMVVLVVGTVAAVLASYFTLMQSAQDGTVLAQQIQKQCETPGDTDPDLAQFCPKADQIVDAAPQAVKADPVPGPPGPTGSTGATGNTGATGPAPDDAAVLEAVRSFCTSTESCNGTNGRNATPGQVAIAIASYCDDRGQCRGPAGATGQTGQNGMDAAPITQAQLASAVNSYCSSNNNCRGPQGPAGTDGKNGTDGADSTVPGPQGPAGTSGVVNVVDNCDPAGANQVISDVTPSYNPDNQTVTISCSYKDDQTGGILQNGSNQ